MPLFRLRSAMNRRLWLAPRLLLASFLRRSSTVSRVWPWPLGLPSTLLGGGGLYLCSRDRLSSHLQCYCCYFSKVLISVTSHLTHQKNTELCFNAELSSNIAKFRLIERIHCPCAREVRSYPFLCCIAARRASALSLSTAGSWMNRSLLTPSS